MMSTTMMSTTMDVMLIFFAGLMTVVNALLLYQVRHAAQLLTKVEATIVELRVTHAEMIATLKWLRRDIDQSVDSIRELERVVGLPKLVRKE